MWVCVHWRRESITFQWKIQYLSQKEPQFLIWTDFNISLFVIEGAVAYAIGLCPSATTFALRHRFKVTSSGQWHTLAFFPNYTGNNSYFYYCFRDREGQLWCPFLWLDIILHWLYLKLHSASIYERVLLFWISLEALQTMTFNNFDSK